MRKYISLVDLIIVISVIAIIMRFVTWKKESAQIPQPTPCARETEIPVKSPEVINTQISRLNSKPAQTDSVKAGGNISYKNAVGEFYDSNDNQQVKKNARIIKREDIANINLKIVACDDPDDILFEKDLGNPYLNGIDFSLEPGNLPAVRVKYILNGKDKNNKSLIIIEKEVEGEAFSTILIDIELTKYLSD